METTIPQTLHEAMKYFSDPQVAFEFGVNLRWPGGVCCVVCNSERVSFIPTEKRWNCKDCKKRFSLKTGTVMEESPLKYETWFSGMWLIWNAKNGISSCEVARSLGITQKTAWFLLHRVREVFATGSIEKLSGTVECDETFVGGKEKNKHFNKKQNLGRGGVGKEIVMGILERGGEMRAKVIPDTTQETLHTEVKDNVEPGAEVFTDAHRGYRGLSPDFKHQWVDHTVRYAEGKVHSNGCENFWSLFKRMLHGTYTHVDPRHLTSYINEEVTRYNLRKCNDGERFAIALCATSGKRLTYKKLTERGLTTLTPEA